MRHPAWALVAVAPLLFGFKLFESRNGEVELGNAALQAGKAEDALAHYDKAAGKLPADPGLHLDRGAALYALSRFAEAGQDFLRATEAQDESLKATAFRNLGNALSKQDKPKEAIEAYKRALALRPDDKAAKWNLEIALRKQREKEKEEEEKKKNDQNKDDKDKDKDKDKKDKQDKKDEKDKDKKDDKKKDDKENKQQDKKSEQDKQDTQDKQDKKDEDKKDKQAQQQPEKPAQEQPERIRQMLQNLEANPKDLERERARLRAVRRMPPARDW